MPHKLEIGQTVIPNVYIREFVAVYEVTRHLPADVTGEPQYRLKSTSTGREMVFREHELRPCDASSAPVGRF